MPRLWIHISPPFTSILGEDFFFFQRTIHIVYISCFSLFLFSHLSCPTPCDPMEYSTPGFPVHHQLLELAQTHVHRVSDVIQPSHPLSSPSPPAPNPSQHQGFSNEFALHFRCPKYWSFSFSISLYNVYAELISFRIDWFDLLAVQGILKSLLQYHNSKTSVPQC